MENSDSAEKGCGAEDCEGVLAVDTTGGGSGAANSGAGNDVGGTEESDTGWFGVGPLDEAEGEGGVGRDREEELLFTMEPAAAGEWDSGAPAEDAPTAAEGGRDGGHPGGPPCGKLVPPLELLLVVTAASEGLG